MPENFEEIIKNFNRSEYYQFLGMEITDIKKGFARLKLNFKDDFKHRWGGVHGGVIASIADAAIGAALVTLIPAGQKVATIEIKINYLDPVEGEAMVAEAKILQPEDLRSEQRAWAKCGLRRTPEESL